MTRCARATQRRRRLVEADVPVGADPEHLQIDAPGIGDFTFVAHALGLRIRGRAVEKMPVLRLDVHVAEQVLLHEASIAARVIRRYAEELVEVERRDLREIDAVLHAATTSSR